ncbi:glycoside hydrolase family 65 protein [Vallitalea sediminicola]
MEKNFKIFRNDFDAKYNKHFEGAFCQGNGYLFLRATFEEGIDGEEQGEIYTREFKSVTTEKQRCAISKWGTYIPIIMGNNPQLNEVIINLPYFMDFNLFADGEKLSMNRCNISDFNMELNLKNGCLTRTFTFNTKSGSIIKAKYERFPSKNNKHLFVQKITYKAENRDANIEISSGIDTNVTTNGFNHFVDVGTICNDDSITVVSKSDMGNTITQSSFLTCDKEKVYIKDNRFSVQYKLKTNEEITFIKKSFSYTDMDKGDIGIKNELEKNYEKLYRENSQVWESLWDRSDVEIEGNDNDQLGVRFSIYHLLRCKEESEYRSSICAKGFAGEAYYGRYFWDSEIFMLPFYIYTNPLVAKNLLMYRYNTLEGAKENAKSYNCKGARYPWQSATTGTEQCSLWEYADNEIHITADIVYGIWHYFKATDDIEFMKNYGAEIIVETARFWLDRVDMDKNENYNLFNVMGPDEYTAFNSNNTFTNRLVKFNLETAYYIMELLKETDVVAFQKLCDKVEFHNNELSDFKEVAEKLIFPDCEGTQYIPQSENFDNYADVDIENIWQDKTKPFGMYMTHEKLYRSKVLKQADSLSLAMLFKTDFTIDQIKNTYEYYEPITTHDSSLSPINHAIVAGWIGKEEHVHKFLKYSLSLDFDSTRNGAQDGIHIANCGCIYQFIMHTVAGIDNALINDCKMPMSKSYTMPESWEKVSFKIMWKNISYKVTVDKNGTKIIKEV